jgi:SOS-response transcriptional repressor LexA
MDRHSGKLKNDELYKRFRKFAFREYLGYGNRSSELNEIYNELMSINPELGMSALGDTIDNISCFENIFNSLNRLNESDTVDSGNNGNACLMLGESAAAGPGVHNFGEIQDKVNLDDLMSILKDKNIFICKVDGDSMKDAGILDGALLFVEKSKYPKPGEIIVASYDGELFVKRLTIKNGEIRLKSENPLYDDILVNEDMIFIIHGIVKGLFQVPK